MTEPQSSYPEHEKLHEVKDITQAIHDFIEFVGGEGIHLAEYFGEGYPDLYMRTLSVEQRDQLITASQGIDLDALREEKEAMFRALQETANA